MPLQTVEIPRNGSRRLRGVQAIIVFLATVTTTNTKPICCWLLYTIIPSNMHCTKKNRQLAHPRKAPQPRMHCTKGTNNIQLPHLNMKYSATADASHNDCATTRRKESHLRSTEISLPLAVPLAAVCPATQLTHTRGKPRIGSQSEHLRAYGAAYNRNVERTSASTGEDKQHAITWQSRRRRSQPLRGTLQVQTVPATLNLGSVHLQRRGRLKHGNGR